MFKAIQYYFIYFISGRNPSYADPAACACQCIRIGPHAWSIGHRRFKDRTGPGDGDFFDRDYACHVHTCRSRAYGILALSSACLAAGNRHYDSVDDPCNGSDGKGDTGDDRKGEER